MDRRNFLTGAGALATAGLAGCIGEFGSQPYVDGTVKMLMSPTEPQDQMRAQYEPIAERLDEHIDEVDDIELQYAANYAATLEAMNSGTGDLAETGPFAAALGVLTDNVDVIIQRYGYGSWEYKSIIATPNDSDIESLSDLSGKTVAFSDRLSTSGALYPLYSMSSEGDLDIGNLPEGNGSQAEFDARFAGGHVQSYTLLEQGQVDAAAMGGFVRDTPTGPTPEDFESVATTLHEDSGLPRAPIVVSTELSEAAKTALQQSFLQAPDRIYHGADGEEGTDDDLWFGDVREAGQEEYQSVIDDAGELGVGTDIFSE
jgi:phosphonate transport system substrate-binding protein